ncbi:MAG TPA: hypothetical protein VNH83_17565 [Bryobacteraceae bacterium]|nr:hypothetical protein [Bryobacteraceae bacterium]
MKILLAIAVIVLGFVCLSAGAYMYLAGDLNSDDEMTAVSPLLRIPLDQLANSGSAAVIVTVPHNVQWERIRRKWGDPGYFVGAMNYPETAGQIHCLDELGIIVEVKANTGAVLLRAARHHPYPYWARCLSAGYEFRASPGTELTIRATSARHPMPTGELIVLCNWENLKDKTVGVMLTEDMHRIAAYPVGIGLAMMLAGTFVLVHRSRATKIDTPQR